MFDKFHWTTKSVDKSQICRQTLSTNNKICRQIWKLSTNLSTNLKTVDKFCRQNESVDKSENCRQILGNLSTNSESVDKFPICRQIWWWICRQMLSGSLTARRMLSTNWICWQSVDKSANRLRNLSTDFWGFLNWEICRQNLSTNLLNKICRQICRQMKTLNNNKIRQQTPDKSVNRFLSAWWVGAPARAPPPPHPLDTPSFSEAALTLLWSCPEAALS